jgi:GntR family transcriptional repressor for pyruvate dehydrogenase complex
MKKSLKIAPLKNLSLVDEVELRVMKFIKDNKLKIGDSIPKELEFAEALGVSRTVVREAMLRLRTLGIVESKKHKGMILTQPDILQNIEKVIESNLLGNQTLTEFFELRLILEMGMSDFLFARIKDEDIISLEKIVNQEENVGENDTFFSLNLEIAFHGKLYEISGNETLKNFQNLLLPVFKFVNDTVLPEGRNFKYSTGKFISHSDLLNELKTGTPETFRTAMRHHLEPHFDRVLEIMKNPSLVEV